MFHMVCISLVVIPEHVSDTSRVFLSFFMTCEKSLFFFMIFTSDVDVLHTQHIIPLKYCLQGERRVLRTPLLRPGGVPQVA